MFEYGWKGVFVVKFDEKCRDRGQGEPCAPFPSSEESTIVNKHLSNVKTLFPMVFQAEAMELLWGNDD